MTQREIFLLEEYLAENIDIAAATQTNIQRVPESAWARTIVPVLAYPVSNSIDIGTTAE